MKPRISLVGQPSKPEKKYKPPQQIKPEHKIFLETVGLKIEELRINRGITVSALCKEIGMSRFGYSLAIGGKVYWNAQTLLKILSFLNKDYFQFFKSLKK